MEPNPNLNKETGEVSITNCFTCSVVKPIKRSFKDDEIVCTELIDKYEKGPTGSDDDFVVYKAPKIVDKYHHRKVIQERCKGQDLKSILARVDKTGDISLLNQRKPVYGDGTIQPQTLSDALEKGAESAAFLDNLSAADKEKYIKLAKDPKAFDEYVNKLVEAQLRKLGKEKDVKQPEVKTDASSVEKGEQK